MVQLFGEIYGKGVGALCCIVLCGAVLRCIFLPFHRALIWQGRYGRPLPTSTKPALMWERHFFMSQGNVASSLWAARKLLCGGGMAWAPGEGGGGGVPEMGFCALPFVLYKDGCCHKRRRNTNFGPEKFFSLKKFPPHMCSQNDQRDMGIILSHVCWGRPPPPPPARQEGQPQPKPPSRHGDQGGGGGGWANGLPRHPPPPQSNFLPALASTRKRSSQTRPAPLGPLATLDANTSSPMPNQPASAPQGRAKHGREGAMSSLFINGRGNSRAK